MHLCKSLHMLSVSQFCCDFFWKLLLISLTLSKYILDNVSNVAAVVSLSLTPQLFFVSWEIRNVHSDNAISVFTFLEFMHFGFVFFPYQVLKSYQDVGISAGNEVPEVQKNESVMSVPVSGVASVFLYFICCLGSL